MLGILLIIFNIVNFNYINNINFIVLIKIIIIYYILLYIFNDTKIKI